MLDTSEKLKITDFPAVKRKAVEVLQVNLGYLCNLSCTHCHVNAGPKRVELATLDTIQTVLAFIDQHNISVLDLTGGAPEMNPQFCYLVEAARNRGVEVIDRCNLTILNEPGYEKMASFLAENQVTVTASLPCYQEKNVSEQRGKGVFDSSILALQTLNRLGYGQSDDLRLNLVYNPNGIFLPPEQSALEASYKKELFANYGIVFNELLTITNMPISRFGSMLQSKGQFEEYMQLLKSNYSAQNLGGVMCLNLLSIDWQGYVYDCDFNQMLGWPLKHHEGVIASDSSRRHLSELLDTNLQGNAIVVGDHCYGCTAGQGSSCGGALN